MAHSPYAPEKLREVRDEWRRWHRTRSALATWTHGGRVQPVIYADMTYSTAIEQIDNGQGGVMMRCVCCNNWVGAYNERFTLCADEWYAHCNECSDSLCGYFVLFADGVCGNICGGGTEND